MSSRKDNAFQNPLFPESPTTLILLFSISIGCNLCALWWYELLTAGKCDEAITAIGFVLSGAALGAV